MQQTGIVSNENIVQFGFVYTYYKLYSDLPQNNRKSWEIWDRVDKRISHSQNTPILFLIYSSSMVYLIF